MHVGTQACVRITVEMQAGCEQGPAAYPLAIGSEERNWLGSVPVWSGSRRGRSCVRDFSTSNWRLARPSKHRLVWPSACPRRVYSSFAVLRSCPKLLAGSAIACRSCCQTLLLASSSLQAVCASCMAGPVSCANCDTLNSCRISCTSTKIAWLVSPHPS